MLRRRLRTLWMSPLRPAMSSQTPFWPAPLTTRTFKPGARMSRKPAIFFGLPGRTRIDSGRRYSGCTSALAMRPSIATTKSLSIVSEPL